MVSTLHWLAEHGLKATDLDSMDNHWALSGFTYFVTAHAQWHPTTFSRDAALAQFSAVGFGPSAVSHASEYINFWETWSQSLAHIDAACRSMPFVYRPTLLAQASAILGRITAACNGYPGCEQKVAFWAEGLAHAKLTNSAIVGRNSSPALPD